MIRIFRAWSMAVAVVWTALADHARAVEVPGIYRAAVPVATQDQAEREQAFNSALAAVLIKATGSRGIAAQPEVKNLVASASRYVQQYGYQDTEPMTLWVQFDGTALRADLTEAKLAVWVEERPAVLVWLAVQEGDDRYLIDEDSGKQARQVVQSVASMRGIPILFPLLDIEDRAQVTVAEVLGGFDDTVTEASARYGADAVAIARATGLRTGVWRARWQLEYADQSRGWEFRGPSLEAVVTEGVHRVADALGERLAVLESALAGDALLVAVDGVHSLEDYAKLRSYLHNLALVQDARMHRVAPGKASFWLQVSGSQADLSRLIGLGDVLEEAPAPQHVRLNSAALGGELPRLYFRLLR